MKHAGLKLGIVLLLAFIGYSAWTLFLEERFHSWRYSEDVSAIMSRAREVIDKNQPPHLDAKALAAGAEELRRRYNALIEKTRHLDTKRPSYKRADDVIIQLELAAKGAESEDVVEARFRTAREWIDQVGSMLGTPQDLPQ